ncbi:hypothetical protein [Bradyrhizobium elkanii]|uniref:hypothetical protein n=1 Tax=Bradyrhizobium elkanii TaxID=29448 RepID=UPI00216A27C1|nr:hypothetical protein [Bradyrhizobium elkanii]MCS3690974.1 hypothetical protein [Bradyrhizobium elkanii]
MPEIEVHTARYEREHNQKPAGRRFWYFTLVSSTVTAKDHYLPMTKQMTYEQALEEAKRVATLRRSERIIVEP